jgi:hypothetical protein
MRIISVQVDGIDTRDYPDFCDAFISEAIVEVNGKQRQATDEELEEINEDSEYVYECVCKKLL